MRQKVLARTLVSLTAVVGIAAGSLAGRERELRGADAEHDGGGER